MDKIKGFISKYKYIIFIFIIYFIFYLQMKNIVFYGDDFEVINPIYNNQDILSVLKFSLSKMNYFWYQWSGRIVGHFTVSFVLSLGIDIFRVMNPIMILLMLYLILKVFSLFRQINIKKYLFFVTFIILGLNIYLSREILYWAYSSILYIWGFDLTLIVIYIVCKSYKTSNDLSWKLMMIISLLTFIQAFILEQLFVILFLILLLIIISCKIKKQKFDKYLILIIICFLGLIISGLAPGNRLRVLPLVKELKPYNFGEIFLCKLYMFFRLIFQNKLYGLYFLTFSIIVWKKYLVFENSRLKKIFFGIIYYSYFILMFISLFFPNINPLNSLLLNYLDAMEASKNLSIIIISVIYFSIYLMSISYMFVKILKKDHRFLFYIYVITLISLIPPVALIRFCGARYGIYFLISLILIIFNFYLEDKNNLIDFKSGILFVFILPFNIYFKFIIIIIYIILFSGLIKKFNNLKFLFGYILCVCLIYCFTNFILTIYNYSLNKKIYDHNELNLKNYDKKGYITLYEIPYERSLYSWHSIVLDFDGSHQGYGFYMNDWYENYYGIDVNKVIVVEYKVE